MSEKENLSNELKIKFENFGFLIKSGFVPKDQRYWDVRWAEWDNAQRQKRLRALSARR